MSSDAPKDGVVGSAQRYKIIEPRDGIGLSPGGCCVEKARHSSEGTRAMRAMLFNLELDRREEGTEGAEGLRGEEGKLRRNVDEGGVLGGLEDVAGVDGGITTGLALWRTSEED